VHRAISVCLMLSVVGCHGGSQLTPAPTKAAVGTYAYRATIGSLDERGTFTIASDTVTLDSNAQQCQAFLVKSISQSEHSFACAGELGLKALSLTINSRDPGRSHWYATTTTTHTREVCLAYGVTDTGARICRQTEVQQYEVESNTSGRLRVTPIAAAEAH
jgi:hypothetical protein